MSAPPPPTGPTHLLRTHSGPLSALVFSDDNERLYSGDAAGLVAATSTRSLRTITVWPAHTDALLGIEECGTRVITHARDNKLHVWTRIEELPASTRLGGAAALSDLPIPTLCYSMDVNALNYCRFSLLPLQPAEQRGEAEETALVGLPNLVDSSVADVWSLPGRERLHAAVGQAGRKSSIFSSEPGERSETGIIMALHLFSATDAVLSLLCAYENGGVILRRFASTDRRTSVEGRGWDVIWNVKLHVETIMAMRVSRSNDLALTVSADHLIGRYDLSSGAVSSTVGIAHKTKHPGNSAIAIRDDGRVCAVAGWDGHIRLYTTRTLKPLGTLKYHKTGCQAVEFARALPDAVIAEGDGDRSDDSGDEDEMSIDDKAARARWLAAGGKDHRVSIWSLMSFERT